MKVKTSSGFEAEIPEGLGSDFRFILARRALKSGDPEKADKGAVDLVIAVLGSEAEMERLLAHLADENGRVPVHQVYREIGEIMTLAAKESKAVKN